jgi:hypothetical protein
VRKKAMRGESQEPLLASVCHNGVAPDDANDCHASPSSPETGLVSKPEVTASHTPKTWFATENPAICTLSDPREPCAAPLPYWMENDWDVFAKVEEPAGAKVGTRPQLLHCESATQRSAEPVSRITLNDTGGVPMAKDP